MDLKYLNTFRVIAEEGSFTRAAERLGYTQSTMTFQMGQLGEALSAPPDPREASMSRRT